MTGQSNLEIIAEGSLMQPGNQALYTLPGSPITNVTELKGKRIGVNALNNIGTLLISSVLQEYGMSPRRNVVEQAMEKLPFPYTVPPTIAAVMSLESYPLSVAPEIDQSRVQRVAEEMYQFQMLARPFKVNSMLGGF